MIFQVFGAIRHGIMQFFRQCCERNRIVMLVDQRHDFADLSAFGSGSDGVLVGAEQRSGQQKNHAGEDPVRVVVGIGHDVEHLHHNIPHLVIVSGMEQKIGLRIVPVEAVHQKIAQTVPAFENAGKDAFEGIRMYHDRNAVGAVAERMPRLWRQYVQIAGAERLRMLIDQVGSVSR